MAKPEPSYRPEVDGLRAVAVISVILFHAKVSLFSGGFVGVDVFFVISGFLITGLLMNDANNGGVSISRFYERRIRRILPALTVVAFCTLVAGCVLFLPAQLIALGKSILATSVFSSNIWFWNQTDYFDPSSEMMPLLHTWSLAVEEHFYIVFPLLIALLCRRPRLLVLVIVALATASLVLCAMQTSRSPAAAFYLLPTRAWELLVGALVALLPLKTPPTLGEASSAIGLVLIVGSIFLMNEAMSFPGVYAVAPVAGAALVIVGGKDTRVGRLLASRPTVWVGLLSYSLYLWHWPILVFAKQLAVTTELSAIWVVGALCLTLGLSWSSWKYVEQPVRRVRLRRRPVFALGSAALTAGVFLGFVPIFAAGFPGRFTAQALAFANSKMSASGRSCLDNSKSTMTACRIGDGLPSFLLWGDSHAGALMSGMEYVGQLEHRSGIVSVLYGCPPLINPPAERSRTHRQNCIARNLDTIRKVNETPFLSTVILSAYWASYSFKRSDLEALVKLLPNKTIVLLEDVPIPGFDVPWSAALRGKDIPEISPAQPLPALDLGGAYPNVHTIQLEDAFCSGKTCPIEVGGHLLYSDSNHLSDYAARELIGPYLKNALRPLWPDQLTR